MKQLRYSLLAAFSVPAISFAQLELPPLTMFPYQPAARDPFLSAAAVTTLLARRSGTGIVADDVLRNYLETVIKAIRTNLAVGGVSITEDPQQSETLINGYAFHIGDNIPLPASPKEMAQLEELAQSYGLPLKKSEDGKLNLEVGQITERGVDLILPGFNAAIYHLALKHEEETTTIQVEKLIKKKTERVNNGHD
jgi:hypothetical protein